MHDVLSPASFEDLTEAVRTTPHVIAIGGGTKPRLSTVPDAVKLSTTKLRGISEYDPSEFTFTAAAGTPVREIAAALAERGQYLPFDPMLCDAGATLGGTVASGLSGPGRFRFGGVRDFILGVRFVDGMGRLLRMGGKVVKNAAGFDLPKFFVGSLGRFGILAEITFKVFPRPPASLTLRLTTATPEDATRILTETARSRVEFEALDIAPDEPGLLARLAAPQSALSDLAREICARWPGEPLSQDAANAIWSGLREFHWAHAETPLLKVPLSPSGASALITMVRALPKARCHLSAGGNLAYISLGAPEQSRECNERLQSLGLSGLTLRGEAPLWLGVRPRPQIAQAVKEALDPENRFPSLDD
jgi:glycolate oxidase FAD binding subunit